MPTKWRSLSWPQTLCDVISPYVLAEVSHDLPLIKRRHWLNWRLKLTELSATGAKDGKRTLTQASLSDHRRRKQAFWLLYPRNNNNNSVYTQKILIRHCSDKKTFYSFTFGSQKHSLLQHCWFAQWTVKTSYNRPQQFSFGIWDSHESQRKQRSVKQKQWKQWW